MRTSSAARRLPRQSSAAYVKGKYAIKRLVLMVMHISRQQHLWSALTLMTHCIREQQKTTPPHRLTSCDLAAHLNSRQRLGQLAAELQRAAALVLHLCNPSVVLLWGLGAWPEAESPRMVMHATLITAHQPCTACSAS